MSFTLFTFCSLIPTGWYLCRQRSTSQTAQACRGGGRQAQPQLAAACASSRIWAAADPGHLQHPPWPRTLLFPRAETNSGIRFGGEGWQHCGAESVHLSGGQVFWTRLSWDDEWLDDFLTDNSLAMTHNLFLNTRLKEVILIITIITIVTSVSCRRECPCSKYNIIVLTWVSSLSLLGRSVPRTQADSWQPDLPDPGYHLGHGVHGEAGKGVLHYVTHHPQLALL